tara:strand:+ start:35 stop:370 length:336 start_codon:yes stop_codon:yes gene_type:complete
MGNPLLSIYLLARKIASVLLVVLFVGLLFYPAITAAYRVTFDLFLTINKVCESVEWVIEPYFCDGLGFKLVVYKCVGTLEGMKWAVIEASEFFMPYRYARFKNVIGRCKVR